MYCLIIRSASTLLRLSSAMLYCLLVRPAPVPLSQGTQGFPEPLLELLPQLLPLRGEGKRRWARGVGKEPTEVTALSRMKGKRQGGGWREGG